MPSWSTSVIPPFGQRSGVARAGMTSSNPQRPHVGRLSAQQVARTVNVSTGFQSQRALFTAYGFAPFTADDYEFGPSFPDIPDYDLALYKTRTGSGPLRLYEQNGERLSIWSLGTGSYTYERQFFVGAFRWLPLLSPVDTEDAYTDGPDSGFFGVCDESNFANHEGVSAVTYSPFFDYPSSGPGFGDPDHALWLTTSSTVAVTNPDHEPYDGFATYMCPGSDATLTLSNPCTWADIEAQAARAATEGYDEYDYGESNAVSYNTGDGDADGTRHMWKRVGRYRINSGDTRRRVTWREVTRRNIARSSTSIDMSTDFFAPSLTLSSRVLTEPISLPYYDEWGAWSPSDLRWDEAEDRVMAWGVPTSIALILIGVDSSLGASDLPELGWSATPRAFACRLRVEQTGTPEAGLVVRVRLRHVSTSSVSTFEDVDLAMTEGVSATLERIAATVDELTSPARLQVETVAILRAGEPVTDVGWRLIYRPRRILKLAGHAAYDGSDTLIAPVRYRVETLITEWGLNATTSNGSEYDAGKRYQVAATGSARLESVKTWNLTLAQPEWVGEPGVVVERAGSFNGLNWFRANHENITHTVVTATERSRTIALTATPQLRAPLDLSQPHVLGEELSAVERDEVVEAGAAGVWRDVNCAVRGAGVFLEDVRFWNLPPAP